MSTATLMRNRPGTKAADFCGWPLPAIEEMDSSFALQQYIQLKIRQNPADIDEILRLPQSQDEDVWQYEHLRMICLELNGFVTVLQEECLPEKCHEMKADEWLYLCATHVQPQNCCAIEYTVHTLDGAIGVLNSTKYFKSRITIPPQSMKHFQSIARRLYRIFAHAYFAHKDLFEKFESENHLYERFIRFSAMFKLIPQKLIIIPGYTLPSDAGGDSSDTSTGDD